MVIVSISLIVGVVIGTLGERYPKQEAALKASEEKCSTLVEKSNDLIVVIVDGVVRFVNSKILEVTGSSRLEGNNDYQS